MAFALVLTRRSMLNLQIDINQALKSDGMGHLKPRILVLTVSPDSSSDYIPIMNCIFSAQKAVRANGADPQNFAVVRHQFDDTWANLFLFLSRIAEHSNRCLQDLGRGCSFFATSRAYHRRNLHETK